MNKNIVLIVIMSITLNMASQCYTKISTKGFHNVAIRSDGSIWTWGCNSNKQIGDGTNTNRYLPLQINPSLDFSSISAGTWNSTAVRNDGTLCYWGRNYLGSTGSLPDTPTPQQILNFDNCISVATGLNNTAAIKSDGTLWAWGWNEYGTIGNGTTVSSVTPIQVGTDTNWKSVSIGSQHIIATKTDGSLWAWGRNDHSSLGNTDFSQLSTPLRIGTENDWNKIYAGYSCNLAIKNDGSLWAWGWNDYGQLGDGTTITRSTPTRIGTDHDWVEIAITTHSLAIKSDGTLWAWGLNNYGKLGLGTTANVITTPTKVGIDNTWIKAITGFEHTVALKDNGTLWAWGHNNYGQLGDGTTIDKALPTQIGITCPLLNQEEFNESTPVISPNPVRDMLNLKFADNLAIDKIAIVDLQGSKIMEINHKVNEINLSDIASGFYICIIHSNEKTYTLKLIKT